MYLAMARGVQRMMSRPDSGLHTTVPPLRSPEEAAAASSGTGSDDIGDVTWTLPSVTLYYPANIPGTPGHNWADAIAMATPIAHKGVLAGAKVQAMTLLDLILQPRLVSDARAYFTDVQTKTVKYRPLMAPSDQPAIWLNAEKMARYREAMRKFYYDPTKYASYLEQLGITYPTVPAVTPWKSAAWSWSCCVWRAGTRRAGCRICPASTPRRCGRRRSCTGH
jgi:aminobenzoyl-glutamate utilization protein B